SGWRGGAVRVGRVHRSARRLGHVHLAGEVAQLVAQVLLHPPELPHPPAQLLGELRETIRPEDEERHDGDDQPMDRRERAVEGHAVTVPRRRAASSGRYTSSMWYRRAALSQRMLCATSSEMPAKFVSIVEREFGQVESACGKSEPHMKVSFPMISALSTPIGSSMKVTHTWRRT